MLDGFSGSTRVTQSRASYYNVISNDYGHYSNVLAQAYLFREDDYGDLIEAMNSLKPIEGWFTSSYMRLEKQPYQEHVLMKLDAVRLEIEKYEGVEKAVLLASLLLGLEKVDNTLGHYVSYLRNYSKRSYGDLVLKQPSSIHFNPNLISSIDLSKNKVFQCDIFELLRMGLGYDLAYYDISYGSNNNKMPSSRVRYAQYYHLLNTVVLNDEPELRGKVARRSDDRICSEFEEFRKNDGKFLVQDSIERLLNETMSRYILFSYNNNGRLLIVNLLELLGDCRVLEIPHKGNVMGDMSSIKNWNRDLTGNTEFLFLKEL